jgi:hypothetical protein
MKKEIRILGIDDAPFSFDQKKDQKKGIVIGVIIRGNSYVEAILSTKVEVDGSDATEKVVEMVNKTKYKPQVKAILIDGIALGGFNVVDIEKLYQSAEIPVITITRNKPNFESIKKALQSHFKDWEKRFNLMCTGELKEIQTRFNPLWVKYVGLDLDGVKEIIKLNTLRGALPEAIRLAHLIARGVELGESSGNA